MVVLKSLQIYSQVNVNERAKLSAIKANFTALPRGLWMHTGITRHCVCKS